MHVTFVSLVVNVFYIYGCQLKSSSLFSELLLMLVNALVFMRQKRCKSDLILLLVVL